MADREPGFYWANLRFAPGQTEWTLAKWTGAGWFAIGINDRLDEEQFTEIGERVEPRRITIDLSDKTLPSMTLGPAGIAGPEGIAIHDLTKPAAQMPDFIFGGIAIPSLRQPITIDDVAEAMRRMSKEEQTLTLIKASYAPGGLQSRMPTSADYIRAAQIIWPEPQPITDAQKTGERFLVWCEFDGDQRWVEGRWMENVLLENETAYWDLGFGIRALADNVTHYLPLPPDVKPSGSLEV